MNVLFDESYSHKHLINSFTLLWNTFITPWIQQIIKFACNQILLERNKDIEATFGPLHWLGMYVDTKCIFIHPIRSIIDVRVCISLLEWVMNGYYMKYLIYIRAQLYFIVYCLASWDIRKERMEEAFFFFQRRIYFWFTILKFVEIRLCLNQRSFPVK